MKPSEEEKHNQLISKLEYIERWVTDAQKRISDLQASKNQAYFERNMLVAVLSRMWEYRLCKHDGKDKDWDVKWMNIVCIHSPAGQLTWHVYEDDLVLFKHLEMKENHWDGHTTEQKYERLLGITFDKPKSQNDWSFITSKGMGEDDVQF